MLTRVDDPDLGSLLQHNVLFKMSETPGGIRSTGRAHAADTEDILRELTQVDPGRLDSLKDDGVIR